MIKLLAKRIHIRLFPIMIFTVCLLAVSIFGLYRAWLNHKRKTIEIESPIVFAEARLRTGMYHDYIRIEMINGIFEPGDMSNPDDDKWIGEFEILRFNGDPKKTEPVTRQPLVIAGNKTLTFNRGFSIIGADTNNDDLEEFAIGQSVDGTYSVYEIVYMGYSTQIIQLVPQSGLLYAAGTDPTISLEGPENQRSEFLWELYDPETGESKTVKYRWRYGEPVIVEKIELLFEDDIQVTETGYVLKGYQWYTTADDFCKNISEGMEVTEKNGKLDSIGKKSLSDTGEHEIWQAYRFQDNLLYGYDFKIITQNEEEYSRLCEMLADKTKKLLPEPHSNPGKEGTEQFKQGKAGRNWIGEDLSSVNIEFPHGEEGYYFIYIQIRAPHEPWN